MGIEDLKKEEWFGIFAINVCSFGNEEGLTPKALTLIKP